MAKKGFSGGMGNMGNMNNMMKQVQKMQTEMQKVQDGLEEKEVEATSGGGAVTVVANGKKNIISITINPEVVDEDDVEMLEDLILTAVNEALRNAEEMVNEEMSKVTGGMDLPKGLF